MASQCPTGNKKTFMIGELSITYPGYKKVGDYRLSINGHAPSHTDIVYEIYNYTTANNFNNVVNFLDELYNNGTRVNINIIDEEYKHKIFWITLQEEINYPQPQYKGRRLPFQRFYEAALIHKGIITLEAVNSRTNNHGNQVPTLLELQTVPTIVMPSFYT